MMQEGKEKKWEKDDPGGEQYVVKSGLAALDEKLQRIVTFLKISAEPDAQSEETLVDGLIGNIDVLSQRIDMIEIEIRKLR